MSDEDTPKVSDLSLSTESAAVLPKTEDGSQIAEEATGTNGTKAAEEKEVVTDDAPVDATVPDLSSDKQTPSKEITEDKPATLSEDSNINIDTNAEDLTTAADEAADSLVDTSASASKSKAPSRRKSGGVPEHKSRKLSRKQSKAKLTHTDAKPGDYFYIRLKGYPLWPAIICDESMLPGTLLRTRPVTALRADGTYREDYQDGGPKVKDRTFAVMYLHTNEFGWVSNRDLLDLDFETVGNITTKMRKDLQEAHKLAAEQHDLEYFKEVLKAFMEQREADLRAAEDEAEEAKAAKVSKPKKSKSQKPVVDGDDDVEMPDADVDTEDAASVSKSKNKRKAEEDGTIPQGNEPSKKLKLNLKLSTPKAPNGTSTPKTAKDTPSAKVTKPKTKKATPKVVATPEAVLPKEPELTAEEKRAKKEKEILFLRHKLQKGLLTRDQPPKEEEMKQMSEFVSKLEGYSELEVSIIRATKINKVLKAILKLSSIPKEEEFKFKPRSQTLLDKWNKLLATEQSTPTAPQAATNGTSETKAEADETKPSPVESTNGAKEPVAKTDGEKTSAPESPSPDAQKDELAATPAEIASDPLPEKPSETSIPAVSETTA